MVLRNFEQQHILCNQIVHNALHISIRKIKSKLWVEVLYCVLLQQLSPYHSNL